METFAHILPYHVLHLFVVLGTLPEVTLVWPFSGQLSFSEVFLEVTAGCSPHFSGVVVEIVLGVGVSPGGEVVFAGGGLYLVFYFADDPVAFEILAHFIPGEAE